MKSDEIRSRFLAFFAARGHTILPSASLVPENDPSVLFTTAGMQPLVPYLLGETHPSGKRLANVQKCIRTQDIMEISDNTHVTFFEMMGNWSLGDYFKEEAIAWSYEFLTSKEEGLGLAKNRLYVTVFKGDLNAPRDEQSFQIWKNLGVPTERIYFLGADDNWWSPGDNGPCGPDTEMFYDLTTEGLGELSEDDFLNAVQDQKIVEIWNDVFMEYRKENGVVVGKLDTKNVDTGSGLERIAMVMQGVQNIFATDIFLPLMNAIIELSSKQEIQEFKERQTKPARILADHIRTSVFIIADGVTPSNTDRGYILRRLLRRAVRYANSLSLPTGSLTKLAEIVINNYQKVYPNLIENQQLIKDEITKEEEKFRQTIERGLKEFEKCAQDHKKSETIESISGAEAFNLFSTYGFPLELTQELAQEYNLDVDSKGFAQAMQIHQDLSRSGAEQKFKGGLADHNTETVRLHTAHHLLLAALQSVLGASVKQRGSNITTERLRIDFSFDRKMTDEEKNEVQKIVNEKIKENLQVCRREMDRQEAEKLGAEMEFGARYADRVSVYFIENSNGEVFSKEFCGGPHVNSTSELSNFKILKEESVSQGVRRIKAVLQ